MRRSFTAFVVLILVFAGAPASARRSQALRYYAGAYALSNVAHRFHLTVGEIAKLNDIEDPNHFNRAGLLLPDTPATRVLPLYVPWTPASPRRTCATAVWSFHEVPRPGCVTAFCGSRGSDEACVCRSADGKASVDLTTSGHRFAALSIEIADFNPFDATAFDVSSVDIDGDGRTETLVSWLRAVSNGLGESFRSLVVFRDHRELVRYDSGELTAANAAVLVGGRCHLASAHYEEATHPLRGSALYLVERTFDPIARRVDEELVGRRASDATRYVLPFEPGAPATGAREIARGTIARTHLSNSWLESLSMRTSGGMRPIPVSTGDDDNAPLRLADAHSRRIFPRDVSFPDMTGTNAILEHRTFYWSRRVLWLE